MTRFSGWANEREPTLGKPMSSMRQHNGEASSSARERILTVDHTATQAQAKGAGPSPSREGGQTMVTAATPLNALPPPSVDGVDR
jgi:hypothetical protein